MRILKCQSDHMDVVYDQDEMPWLEFDTPDTPTPPPTFEQVLELAQKRGMKVSKAAARLGFSPAECKAFSVASKVEIFTDEESMVEAVRSHGQSCMTASPLSYRYWAQTRNAQFLTCMAVAVYGDSRCLVRTDNRTFVQAYGSQSGEIIAGLKVLGFAQNPSEFSEGLEIPKKLFDKKEETVTKTVFIPKIIDRKIRCVVIVPYYSIQYFGKVTRHYLSDIDRKWHSYETEATVYKRVPETDLVLYQNKKDFSDYQSGFGPATIDLPYYECKQVCGKWVHPKYGVISSVRLKNVVRHDSQTRTKTRIVKEEIRRPYHDGLRQFL